ncbi:MAG: hypothetical protein HOP19_01100 [Acidobacteria bacterium]|nr:hypothetical protein [Acidobacteriota bacterium]
MTTATVQLTKPEIVRRGKEIYEQSIRSEVEDDNKGRVVAIDVISGDYVMADDEMASLRQLRANRPEAVIFLMRVGYPTLHRLL